MLNLSPTNLEGNGDSPEVIVESASEDDEIDISQFVESVLDEPVETPNVASSCPPPLIYIPTSNVQRPQFIRPNLLPCTQPAVCTVTTAQIHTIPVVVPSGVQNVGLNCGSGSTGRPGLQPIRPNYGAPNFFWLRDCFSKIKNSSLTLNYQVKCLEERFKTVNKDSDAKKVMSIAQDLQALLKQTELGYKYLGNELTTAQEAYAQSLSQRNNSNRINTDVIVRRQVLLPVSPERKVISSIINAAVTTGITLPPNMLISVNGTNHSLSITLENETLDTSALCAKFDIKPCYVLLERCDDHQETENDDIEIIGELIAL